LRAAIYSRFSTDKQTESSIADQVRVCTEYAEKQGWSDRQPFRGSRHQRGRRKADCTAANHGKVTLTCGKRQLRCFVS
jgi:DNA invertase Pin-like site-specific DNA recombinase